VPNGFFDHAAMMIAALPPLVLVVIAGPQASGKSALAAALADELCSRGELVAVVELDQIASMSHPALPDWEVAHQITEVVAHQWLRAGMSCVIVEGVATREKVLGLLRQAPAGVPTMTVATTAPFDVAYARAVADLTRGVSREEDYLRTAYARWQEELPRLGPDLTLHTDRQALEQCVETVCSRIDRARFQSRSTIVH
jgi:adenylylsulfate kinase-like enzyme